MSHIVRRYIDKLKQELKEFMQLLEDSEKKIKEFERSDMAITDEYGVSNESKLTFLEVKYIETRAMTGKLKLAIYEMEKLYTQIEHSEKNPFDISELRLN